MFNELFASFNIGLILLIAFMIIAILGMFKIFDKKGTRKKVLVTGLIGFAIVLILVIVPGVPYITTPIQNLGGSTLAIGDDGKPITCPTGTSLVNGVCIQQNTGVNTYQPTATYSTQDKYSTTSISGTSYYKKNAIQSGNDFIGGVAVSTTAISNIEKNVPYVYWVSNTSYYVKPDYFVGSQTSDIVNVEAYQNGTASLTGYDTIGKAAITGGVASNISMGANDQANIEFTYQTTNKRAAVPFGGVLVLEYNNTISDVSCTMDGASLGDAGDFQVTYTPSSLSHTSKQFRLPYGLDDTKGTPKVITCQFNNGATAAGAGSEFYAKISDANYYVTNDKNIVLDTEKTANQDNTRTGLNTITFTGYWAA